MSTSESSSPTSKLLALAVLSLAILIQCKSEMYLGLDRDRFADRLAQGDYSFFDTLDGKRLPGAEILSFAPGAGYYLGLAAFDRGRLDLAAHFFGLEADRDDAPGGSAPHSHWAARELLEVLNKTGQYAAARDRAAAWLARHPDSPVRDRVRFREIEARYWLKDDAAVLAKLDEYFPGGAPALVKTDLELYLFQVVASTRLGLAGWEDLIRDFYETLRASALHQRLHAYLTIEKDKLAAFTAFERDLFAAKALLGDGREREAAAALEPLLPRLGPAALARGVHTGDYAAACIGSRPTSRQAEFLLGLAAKLKDEERAALLETAGRIFLLAKNHARARTVNQAALEASANPLRRKRALHRLLSSGVELGAAAALALFKTHGPAIDDPDYFDDVCDALVNRLVLERRYQSLLAFALAPPAWWPASEKPQLTYVGARLLMTGLAAAPDKDAKITSLLTAAAAGNARGYYAFMSAHFLGDTGRLEDFFREIPGSPAGAPEKLTEKETLIDGLFRFGLYRRALGGLSAGGKDVKNETIAWWAGTLAGRDRPYESIQLVSMLRSRSPDALTRRDYGAYYPRAFAPLVASAAVEYGLDQALFFALIRQESAFNPGIGSTAGAVGLTQLMPDTGVWIAGLLKTERADLTDPATSVRFGAFYLDWLGKRFDALPFVLAGYNGGPTNAKRWRLAYGNLPPDLAVEAVDFPETRDFIKSIFSARVIYGLMYGRTGIRETAGLFYNF